MQIGYKQDNVSVNRLKPVFSDNKMSPALPPPHGRPPRSPPRSPPLTAANPQPLAANPPPPAANPPPPAANPPPPVKMINLFISPFLLI